MSLDSNHRGPEEGFLLAEESHRKAHRPARSLPRKITKPQPPQGVLAFAWHRVLSASKIDCLYPPAAGVATIAGAGWLGRDVPVPSNTRIASISMTAARLTRTSPIHGTGSLGTVNSPSLKNLGRVMPN